eukprot:CAMPEP_0196590912 /NCGR_PEP_ID=MMETSP1081-20130531/67937_1 /TAXON_ID=36882 /ORGANISM="Pyramimonas amylifera, Strain CCMP720" /LENGTH=394 /DNA_ID=CAMNT_0041914137 /DNA_START=56 /DNA_END=1240 /DNA_ORIENTATION=+
MFLNKFCSIIRSNKFVYLSKSLYSAKPSGGTNVKHPSRIRFKPNIQRAVRKPVFKKATSSLIENRSKQNVEDNSGDKEFYEFMSTSFENQERHIILNKNFLKCAEELKDMFDSRFSDPRETHPERFLWDYWHVPKQYSLVRTPAQLYFPEELYQEMEDSLLEYAQEVLGCRACTQIWLSYYTDGHFQALHTDAPHGPWAFVLSLTDWENRRFEGGETMIMQPGILDYWKTFDPTKGLEAGNLFSTVPPDFNQLAVFDPRLPHQVARIQGTQDPRYGRLVLHGWFTEPAPFFTGALEAEDAGAHLDLALDRLYGELAQANPAFGVVTVRMEVSGKEGSVTELQLLTDTLIGDPVSGVEDLFVREEILSIIYTNLKSVVFPPAVGDSSITLPFVFE